MFGPRQRGVPAAHACAVGCERSGPEVIWKRYATNGRIVMANVAFIGTGLLGSAMVEGMLRRGERVTVWNRTEAKARALEKLGARVAATPADAVADAERVHMTLPDDAVVDEIVAAFMPRLRSEEHTSELQSPCNL